MHFADARTIDKLLTDALAQGFTVSVHDGEAWPLKKSTDKAAIIAALESTDMDTLRFRDATGAKIGDVDLVHGNEPGVIMADHSDNDAMNALLAPAYALAEKLTNA